MRRFFPNLALALSILLSLSGRVEAQSGEWDIKAAFVYNFAKFVEWPADALGPTGGPLNICAVGNAGDPLLSALPRLEGKPVQGREIRVRLLAPRDSLKSCHMVVIGDMEGNRPAEALKPLASQPTLTVSASDHFVDAGGMIGFVNTGNKIQFEINLDAAQRANLRLSAQFVSLARSIRK